MEGKKAKDRISRFLWHQRKRTMALILAFMMTFINAVNNVSIALAEVNPNGDQQILSSDAVIFELDAQEVRELARTAADKASDSNASAMYQFLGESDTAEQYRNLFSGSVREITPAYDTNNDDVELKVFIKGNEKVIFLFINDTEELHECTVSLNGYMTDPVFVEPYANLIVEEKAPAPEAAPAPSAGGAGGNSGGGSGSDNAGPAETTDETVTEVDTEDKSETNGEEADATDDETVTTDDTKPAEGEEVQENEAADKEASDDSDQAKDAETGDSNKASDESGAADEGNTAGDNASAEEGNTADDNASTDEGNEADDNTSTDESNTADDNTSTDEGNTADDNASTDEGNAADDNASADEGNAADDQTSSDEGDAAVENTSSDEDNAADDASADEGNTADDEAASNEADGSSDSGAQASIISNDLPRVTSSIELLDDGEAEDVVDSDESHEEDIVEETIIDEDIISEDILDEEENDTVSLGVIDCSVYDPVAVDGAGVAAVVVSLADLDQIEAIEEVVYYGVVYHVDNYGAAVVNGVNEIEAGKDLTFVVKPQKGYTVDSVFVNGEEVDSESDYRYVVEAVSEDIEVEVATTETSSHPAFNPDPITIGDVTITVSAEPGVIPEGTELVAEAVTAEKQAEIEEKVTEEAAKNSEEVVEVLSYNIDLFYQGEKLTWNEGSVLVEFSGAKIEEKAAEADVVDIVHVDTDAADEIELNTVATEDVSGEEQIEAVGFDAKHFSTYTVTFKKIRGGDFKLNVVQLDENGNKISSDKKELTITEWDYEYSFIGKYIDDDTLAKKMAINGYDFVEATTKGKLNNKGQRIYWLLNSGKNFYRYDGFDYSWIDSNSTVYFWYKEKSVQLTHKSGNTLLTGLNKTYNGKEEMAVSELAGVTENGYTFTRATLQKSNSSSATEVKRLRKDGENYQYSTETAGNNWKNFTGTPVVYFWYDRIATITFVPNGGTGDSFSLQAVKRDNYFTFSTPQNPFEREGYTFVGWSLLKDGNGDAANSKEEKDNQSNFIPGVELKVSGDKTYYAIWVDNDGIKNTTAYFFVRTQAGEAAIKIEPAAYNSSDYYPQTSNKGADYNNVKSQGKLRTLVAVNNNFANVKANLADEPTPEELDSFLPDNLYNPNTDTVLWYVIKNQGGKWHVDGVVVPKDRYSVSYNANGGTSTSESLPATKFYLPGATVDVEFKPLPTREDYNFLGWDENPEAVTPTYRASGSQDNSFTMPEENVTLYAIWGLKPNLSVDVKYVEYNPENNTSEYYATVEPLEETTISNRLGKSYTVEQLEIVDYTIYGILNPNDPESYTGVMKENMGTIYVTYKPQEKVTIMYVANEGGSVSRPLETLAPVSGTAKGSTAAASTGYSFLNWTNEAGEVVGNDPEFIPKKAGGVNVSATYYANFKEDENVIINYVAKTGGSVDNASETLAPATGTAEGSTASAEAGYHFVNWTDAAGTVVSEKANYIPSKTADGVYVSATYYANFAEDEDILIQYKATEGGSVKPESETLAPVTDEAAGSIATAVNGYHFVNWTNEEGYVVGTTEIFVPERVNGLNVAATYTAHFSEDEKVTIRYQVAADSVGMGSVSSESEQVAPATGAPNGSVANAADGNKFVKWTDAEGNTVSTNKEWIPQKINGVFTEATYYAHFTERGDLSYEVHYYYDGTEAADERVVENAATLNEVIPYTSVSPKAYQNKNYVLDRVEGAGKKVTAVAADNVVKVYYDLDETGENDPKKPDGIADKYQITFTYKSGPNGSISGEVVEVVTRDKNSDGTFSTTNPAHPKGNVTVTGNNRYYVNNWTSGTATYSNLDEIRAAGFTEDTEFTVNWRYRGGGSTGGGGGGSSSGTKPGRGNGGDSGNGPGTTTINPANVPLANLPEDSTAENGIMIDDGEVPLAALPKTGNPVGMNTVMAMLSGMLLAAYLTIAKKKDEEA